MDEITAMLEKKIVNIFVLNVLSLKRVEDNVDAIRLNTDMFDLQCLFR